MNASIRDIDGSADITKSAKLKSDDGASVRAEATIGVSTSYGSSQDLGEGAINSVLMAEACSPIR